MRPLKPGTGRVATELGACEWKGTRMTLYALWSAAGTLVLVWLLAVCGVLAMGGWVHLLLAAALFLLASSLVSRPRIV